MVTKGIRIRFRLSKYKPTAGNRDSSGVREPASEARSAPGNQKVVTITLSADALRDMHLLHTWNSSAHRWTTPALDLLDLRRQFGSITVQFRDGLADPNPAHGAYSKGQPSDEVRASCHEALHALRRSRLSHTSRARTPPPNIHTPGAFSVAPCVRTKGLRGHESRQRARKARGERAKSRRGNMPSMQQTDPEEAHRQAADLVFPGVPTRRV